MKPNLLIFLKIAHLLYLGDFYFRNDEEYEIKLLIPTLSLGELKKYDQKFNLIWNAFCIVRDTFVQPEIWEEEFEKGILSTL